MVNPSVRTPKRRPAAPPATPHWAVPPGAIRPATSHRSVPHRTRRLLTPSPCRTVHQPRFRRRGPAGVTRFPAHLRACNAAASWGLSTTRGRATDRPLPRSCCQPMPPSSTAAAAMPIPNTIGRTPFRAVPAARCGRSGTASGGTAAAGATRFLRHKFLGRPARGRDRGCCPRPVLRRASRSRSFTPWTLRPSAAAAVLAVCPAASSARNLPLRLRQ